MSDLRHAHKYTYIHAYTMVAVLTKLHSWGGVAACFPEKPAKLAAVLGS